MNKMKHYLYFSFCFYLFFVGCKSPFQKELNPQLIHHPWPARWITPKNDSTEYGVFHFRKSFVLSKKPEHFIIHISADNRYILYVNNHRIIDGPAAGDIKHWQFETVDIAPNLQKDSNVISAVVWNYGSFKPWRQFSLQTAFILQSNSDQDSLVNTNQSWKYCRDSAYDPILPSPESFYHTTGTGSYEKIFFKHYPWNWNSLIYDDSTWETCIELCNGSMLPSSSWQLIQREIPFMDYKEERMNRVVRTENIPGADVKFFKGTSPLIIPPNSKVTILLDNSYTTTAFPVLSFSEGKGSSIKITYNESLYDDTVKLLKSNRGETKNKLIKGLFDLIHPDGGMKRFFEPLAYRTYRFVQFDIKTSSQQLILEDYKEYFSAYPFELKSSFICNDTTLNELFTRGWRTVRLCSHDCYIDCPYYEQLQYFGDLNITTRVTACLSGDFRLVRQTLKYGSYANKDHELMPDAYPQSGKTIIPSFAISWIDILEFYNEAMGDTSFTRTMIPDVNKIMNWYESKIDTSSYMLGPMPFWNFVDCTLQWPWKGQIDGSCEPPGTKEGHSALLTLQYLYGLQKAEKIYRMMNLNQSGDRMKLLADKIKSSVTLLCWNNKRNLFADVPEKNSYSQHTNYMALVTGIVPKKNIDSFLYHVNNDKDLVQSSLQFRAYLHNGMKRYNRLDHYTDMLKPWKIILDLGCTTFPEFTTLANNRSETHAWTTFPILEMITVILGIQPVPANSDIVMIEPHPGNLTWAEGSLPCNKGLIKVRIDKNKTTSAKISIPLDMKGIFKLNGKVYNLKGGENILSDL